MFTGYDLGLSFQNSFMGMTEPEVFSDTFDAGTLPVEQIDQIASHPYAQFYNSESLAIPNGHDFNSVMGIGNEPLPRLSYEFNELPGFSDALETSENEALSFSFAGDQVNLDVGAQDDPVHGSIHWDPATMSWDTMLNADLNGTSFTYDPGTGATSVGQQITDSLSIGGSYNPDAGAGSASLEYGNFDLGAFMTPYDWGANAYFNIEF